MSTVEAVLLAGASPAEPTVEQIEVGVIAPGHVRVRVDVAGVCGSDLAVVSGQYPCRFPAVLGHEAVGTVTETGDGVELTTGTRVTLWMAPPCRMCRRCLNGEAALCSSGRRIAGAGVLADGSTRFSRDGETLYRSFGLGAFSHELVVPEAGAIAVPDDVPDDVAAVVGCGVATGAGAILNVARPQVGDTVLVLGAGGVGLSAIMAARAVGTGTIVAADPREDRRRDARRAGATVTLEGSSPEEMAAELRELGTEIDVVVDAAGRPELVELGLKVVREGGTVVAVGLQPSGSRISISGQTLSLSQRRLLGCFMGAIDPHRDLPRLFAMYQQGRFPVDTIDVQRCTLDELPAYLSDPSRITGSRLLVDVGASRG